MPHLQPLSINPLPLKGSLCGNLTGLRSQQGRSYQDQQDGQTHGQSERHSLGSRGSLEQRLGYSSDSTRRMGTDAVTQSQPTSSPAEYTSRAESVSESQPNAKQSPVDVSGQWKQRGGGQLPQAGQSPTARHSQLVPSPLVHNPLLHAVLVSQASLQSPPQRSYSPAVSGSASLSLTSQSPEQMLSPTLSLTNWGWNDCQQVGSPRQLKCGSPRFGSILDERRQQMTRVSATIDELLAAIVGDMVEE